VPAKLLSVEVIVESVDRAIEILVNCFGCALIDRSRTEEPAGERALVDAGSIVLTLLEPSPHGPGFVLPDRSPQFSQFVFGGAQSDVDDVEARCESAGLAIEQIPGSGWYVTRESAAGALGVHTAMVFTAVPGA
jgi:hypothetical protein